MKKVNNTFGEEIFYENQDFATNIVDGRVIENHDHEKLNVYFDYYSWNPYFDGNYDIIRANERFNKYILKK